MLQESDMPSVRLLSWAVTILEFYPFYSFIYSFIDFLSTTVDQIPSRLEMHWTDMMRWWNRIQPPVVSLALVGL